MLHEPRQYLRNTLSAREEFATLSLDALRSELSSSADLLRKQSSTLRAFFDDPSYEDVRGGRFADGVYVLQWQELNIVDFSGLITPQGRIAIFPVTDRSIEQHWPFDVSLRFYAGKSVLDHCCGGGNRVVQLRGLGIDAYGFDTALPFNAHVIPVYSKENVLHFARANRLPFGDDSFDIVEARFGSLYYAIPDDAADLLQQLREVARVLKPGGVLRVYPLSVALREVQDAIGDLFDFTQWEAEQAVLTVRKT